MDQCWRWSSNTLATWCKELTHWKRPWCWEWLRAGGEVDDRGWDGWMASLTEWTWVWTNSGRWWRTGKLGVLQSMGHKESDSAEWLNNNVMEIMKNFQQVGISKLQVMFLIGWLPQTDSFIGSLNWDLEWTGDTFARDQCYGEFQILNWRTYLQGFPWEAQWLRLHTYITGG